MVSGKGGVVAWEAGTLWCGDMGSGLEIGRILGWEEMECKARKDGWEKGSEFCDAGSRERRKT